MRSAVARLSYKLTVETNDIFGCLKKARNERRTETKAFVKKIKQCLDIHPIGWSYVKEQCKYHKILCGMKIPNN